MSLDRLIRRLMTVYGEPRTDDPAGFLMEYQKALGGYSDAIFDRVGDVIIKEIGPFWPKPAEAVKIARSVAGEIWRKSDRAIQEQEQFAAVQAAPPSPHARARVQEIMDGYMEDLSKQDAGRIKMRIDVTRPTFEAMQAKRSSAQYLHRKPALSPISRRMSGDA